MNSHRNAINFNPTQAEDASREKASRNGVPCWDGHRYHVPPLANPLAPLMISAEEANAAVEEMVRVTTARRAKPNRKR